MHTTEDSIDDVGIQAGHAIELAMRLHEVSPKHDLLKFMFNANDNGVWEEFQTRFGKPGSQNGNRGSEPAIAYCLTQYLLTVTAELQKLRATRT